MTQPAEKRGPGRRPAGEAKRGHAVRVQVTQAERAELAAWAAREGRPLAELLRDRGLRAARRSRPDEPTIVLAPNQSTARYNSTPPAEPWPERGTFAGSTSTPRPDIIVMPWQDPPKRRKRRGA